MAMEFPGVALVTGAAGTGIGNAVARAFADAGCKNIAITDRNSELLRKTALQIRESHPEVKVLAGEGDISDPSFVDEFIEQTVKQLGRLDYAVNCAGIMGNNQPSTETSLEDFDRINNVNYRGCWLSSRAELKAMKAQEPLLSATWSSKRPAQRGSIVNIASQLGIVGRPAAPTYCASKSAVIGLTRCDAIDYSKHGIRVNCICPGVIETPMTSSTPEQIKRMEPAVPIAPMNRMGQPEEIADCALFLCSARASFVQGHAMVVDGGYIIN